MVQVSVSTFFVTKVLILFQENQTEDYSYQIRTVIMYRRDVKKKRQPSVDFR